MCVLLTYFIYLFSVIRFWSFSFLKRNINFLIMIVTLQNFVVFVRDMETEA